jgi:PRTRC genetic system ThiF family protein
MIKLRWVYNSTIRLVIVGTGGTGGILVQNLAHYVYGMRYRQDRVQIILVDGDVVEERNVGRQKFTLEDIGHNKAERLAIRYSDVFGLDIQYVPDYIRNEETLLRILLPADEGFMLSVLPVLVMCVDNNFTRQVAHRVFMDDGVERLIYIDTGNENGRGQTVLGLKWNGNIIQDPCGLLFPDILTSDDPIREGGSCSRTVEERPQTLLENMWSATVAMTYLYNLIENGEVVSHYTYFDAVTGRAREVQNSRIKEIIL